MQKGFTLIELLVVVLIIGILASVALPMYTRAVDKSRGTEALTITKSLVDAQNIYYLANGSYTTNLEDLDITVPEAKGFYINAAGSVGDSLLISASSRQKNAILYHILSGGKITHRYCAGSNCMDFFGVGCWGTL